MESIKLTISNPLVDEISIDQVFDQPSEAAFFVHTFDTVGEPGYRVWIEYLICTWSLPVAATIFH